MPRLVKGGKYVYGWSKVGKKGRIVIPPEALEEYNLTGSKSVYLVSGSKRSGGFGVTTMELLEDSPLAVMVNKNPPLAEFQVPEGEVVDISGRPWCWVQSQKGSITIPPETLALYGVSPGDLLLSVRGSRVALGFLIKGPIIEEAKTHSEIELFE